MLFQVNISLAILFAIEGFHPINEGGQTLSHYPDLNSALPLVTFMLSLFASSFGMSKFLLLGPLQLISSDSAFNLNCLGYSLGLYYRANHALVTRDICPLCQGLVYHKLKTELLSIKALMDFYQFLFFAYV